MYINISKKERKQKTNQPNQSTNCSSFLSRPQHLIPRTTRGSMASSHGAEIPFHQTEINCPPKPFPVVFMFSSKEEGKNTE